MQANCPVLKSLGEFQENMRQNWVIMSSTDTELLHSFLLAACRDLSITRLQKEYTEFAIEYKLRYVQKLRQTISVQDLSSSRTAVTRALVLAFDDVSQKSQFGLWIVKTKLTNGARSCFKTLQWPQSTCWERFISLKLQAVFRLLD